MKISRKGTELIKRFEGCQLTAYKCPAGVWTIGYGHTRNVKMGMKITQQEAEKFLLDDVAPCENILSKFTLKQNQFDALVSWIFNLGVGNFNSSTLKLKLLAKASDIEVADQIIRWTKANGKVLLGLQKRRVAEANMYVGQELYYMSNGEIKRK
jgi:lysozyme